MEPPQRPLSVKNEVNTANARTISQANDSTKADRHVVSGGIAVLSYQGTTSLI